MLLENNDMKRAPFLIIGVFLISSQTVSAEVGDCGLSAIFSTSQVIAAALGDLATLQNESERTKISFKKDGKSYWLQTVSLASADAQSVFKRSLDYEKYPELKIPGVLETNILSQGEGNETVWFHTNLMHQDARYSVGVQFGQTQQDPNPQYLIQWNLANSDDGKLQRMSGQWCLSQIGENEILIRYDLILEFHTSAPRFLYEHNLESQMKSDYTKMLQAFTQ
jgi:ribosome-associated toxin RatA of RatAB toxin-antitoxin module